MLHTPPTTPELCGSFAPEDRLGQILAGCIQLTHILGVGAYGVVYKAVDVNTGVQYAVKALNKVGLEPRQRSFQQREISVHSQVSDHPNVVKMLQILHASDCTYVILEFCPEGDLFAKITDEARYVGNDHLAKEVFLQILDAVEYCHNKSIYHRDLKPENILVQDDGFTVKLADFGLATKEAYTSDFGCGSTFYMSPECQETSPAPYQCYSSAANDVWSLGVILVNLTCGRNPWKRASFEDSTYRAYCKDRNFLKSILPLSPELDYILKRVFEPNAYQRITVRELKELVLKTRSFTTTPQTPVTPPYSPVEAACDNAFVLPQGQVPVMPVDMDTRLAAQVLANHLSQLSTGSDASYEHQNQLFMTPPSSPPRVAPQPYAQAQRVPCAPQTFIPSTVSSLYGHLTAFHLPRHTNLLPQRVF